VCFVSGISATAKKHSAGKTINKMLYSSKLQYKINNMLLFWHKKTVLSLKQDDRISIKPYLSLTV